ncbi:alkaline phosphatase [Pedobacter nutrimenti]|jgi:alkaline phosphatase|uniref:Alkaline phosphatase n=1 Tax=Pedobacter nutrimenti TaxID=1241337 RepID=A0A318UGC3_9SPHI|nr:alkaline phosphatase [Pedobacter nutrimenti]PYF74417.1 alkaline phosphatase [Pedobacter nutrimenti]
MKKITFLAAALWLGVSFSYAQELNPKIDSLMYSPKKTVLQQSKGHSHNDYKQDIPFFRAYFAGMQSIEADVFLKQGALYVAHDSTEIRPEKTLLKNYIEPLAKLYKENKGHAFADPLKKLQLVIDIKENHLQVIPSLLKEIQPYRELFNTLNNPDAIQLVISGDMPKPSDFDRFDPILQFDGRPYTTYSSSALKRIAMISDDLKNYSKWNGKGVPNHEDAGRMKTVIDQAHAKGKPFRFWASNDSPNTWIVLEKFGVDWLNTDLPEKVQDYYRQKGSNKFQMQQAIPVFKPSMDIKTEDHAVRNVILLIGDGMGLSQVKAGLSANHGQLSMIAMPVNGLARTEAANSGNTDSAAGGTAFATGAKTNNGYVGLDPKGKRLSSLADTLYAFGLKSGIISTGDVCDATPAVFYAHQPDRNRLHAIAADFLSGKVDILIGSGAGNFYKNTIDKDLLNKIKNKGYRISNDIPAFQKDNSPKQLVLLPDAETRPIKDGRTDWLSRSLEHTMAVLDKNKEGFFIMAEGAQIDYGGHANDLPYAVTELLDFDKAVAAALRFAEKDQHTLVVVTADHETGGLSLLDCDEQTGYVYGTFSTNDHTNVPVPVFAYGPGSRQFTGVYQNTAIYDKILELIRKGKKK